MEDNKIAADDQLEDPFAHIPARKPRIVNGDKSNPSNRSFFAKAGYDQYSFTNDILCGATLIWSDIAITAAHCQGAFNNGLLTLDQYTNDYTKVMPIDRQSRHPGWSTTRKKLNYDVLVLRLTTPLSDSDAAKPIPINTNSYYPTKNQQLKAYGFGLTENQVVSDYLREADVTYISNDECFGRGITFNNVLNSQEVMCTDPFAKKTATCLGDSGGPLTDATGSTLMGVISFGSGCEADLIPDGHVRLSQVSDWVEKQICSLSANPPSSCSSDAEYRDPRAVEIVIDFTHDFYPEHTTFAVRSKKTQETLYAGPKYIPTRNGNHKESIFLFPGEYIFEVYDVEGNGLASDMGDGLWKVSALYDGCTETQVANGGPNFKNEQATKFAISEGMVTYNSNCGAANAADSIASYNNGVDVKDAISAELDECLINKNTELTIGAMFPTDCECLPNETSGRIELSCVNENGQSCSINYETCIDSTDCCSGRRCIGGQCRSSSPTTAGRNSNRLGGTSIGGAANGAGGRSGNLRQR